jgi:hypothetical protein
MAVLYLAKPVINDGSQPWGSKERRATRRTKARDLSTKSQAI